MLATPRLAAVGETPSARAAPAKLALSATAAKVRNWSIRSNRLSRYPHY
jgi:hypothetical protein